MLVTAYKHFKSGSAESPRPARPDDKRTGLRYFLQNRSIFTKITQPVTITAFLDKKLSNMTKSKYIVNKDFQSKSLTFDCSYLRI